MSAFCVQPARDEGVRPRLVVALVMVGFLQTVTDVIQSGVWSVIQEL